MIAVRVCCLRSGVQNAEAFEIFAKDHGLIDIKTASPTVENPE
jgi:hypothetical protein